MGEPMISPCRILVVAALWVSLVVGAVVAAIPAVTRALVIGESRPAVILCAQGLATLGDGRIVVADRLDYRLKIFDSAGRLVARVGGRGKQDGAFRGPGPVDCSAYAVAVADFASGRVQLFSRSFHHLRTLDVPGSVADLCFDARGTLWVSIIRRDNRGELLRYLPDGATSTTVPLRNVSGNPFHDVCTLASTPGGTVLAAYMTRNIVEVYEASGQFLREFTIGGLPAASPVEQVETDRGAGGIEVPIGVVSWNLTVDGSGRIYVLAGECSQNPGREVFVLDPDGRVLGNMTLPERAVRIRADRNGFLWAVSSRRGTVVQYRVSGGGSGVH